MKRILLALAMLALLLPSAPRAEARVDVSIDFFYNNLSGGSWVEVGDYGYCWQPTVAVSDSRWRPYSDGYWAYTDLGWTWVSYEDFGWATYHYGRWARLRDHGWVWVPGYEWGPAWVSWRTGGDYVGWAPLPPRRSSYRRGEVVYEGRPIGTSVDIEFDIGPAYYNFVDVRYIGAPVLREHIYAPTQNITYINQTVNVTNITYNNSTFHNYGPDYNRLSAYSARPIQRLNLERQTAADLGAAGPSGAFTKVQGDRLVVSAPPVINKPAEPVAPPAVKTKIETPTVETGWSGITDPNAKAQIQEKIKKEDPKKVPPPQIAPKNPEALNAASPEGAPAGDTATAPPSGNAAATGSTAATMERGKGKGNKRGGDAAPAAAPTTEADGAAPPQTSDTALAPAANDQRGRGKEKDRRRRDRVLPQDANADAVPAQPAGVVAPPADDQRGRGKDKAGRGRDRVQPAPADQPADAGAPASAPGTDSLAPSVRDSGRGQGKRGGQMPPAGIVSDPAAANAPAETAPAAPPSVDEPKQEKNRGRGNKERARDDNDAARVRPADLQPAIQPQAPDRGLYVPNAGAPNDGDGGRGRGKMKRERMDVPPQPAPAPEMAPPPQAPAREMMQEERGRGRRERQAPPPDMAPPPQQGGPAMNAPQPPPEGRGKPERGNKKKKDDGQPNEP